MGRIIKEFTDGSYLEYDRGKFDDWCVYLSRPGKGRKPPLDTEYFKQMREFAEEYDTEVLYNDFVEVYDLVKKEVYEDDLNAISEIAEAYGGDSVEIDIIFTILYMAMIAEEQKRYTKLGKRIKRLGVHMVLVENKNIYEAANFMRGMGWREIDALCRERGF